MSARRADSSASGAEPRTRVPRQPQLGNGESNQIGLRCAGTDNRSAAAGACERAQQAEPGFACVFGVSCRSVRNDDDVGADSGLDRLGPG